MDENMDKLCISLITLICVSCSRVDGRVEETVLRTVQPGDNVTLHCDVKNELLIIWYRQCSHENQPLWEISFQITERLAPRYHFIWNSSSESSDLRIENITESDLGIFYCAASFTKVEEKDKIYGEEHYRFGNITTRLKFADHPPSSTDPPSPAAPEHNWIMLTSMISVSAVVFILVCVFMYWLGEKQGLKQSVAQQWTRVSGAGSTAEEEDEQLNYASLQIRTGHKRTRRKPPQNNDFSTYSEVHRSV